MIDLVFSLLLTGFGVFGLLHKAREFARAVMSRRWPVARAIVLSTDVHERVGSRGRTLFEPVVQFQYRFEDKDYTAHRLAFGDVTSRTRAESEHVSARFAIGSVWEVRVCPRRPELHVIHAGPTGRTWFDLAFFVVYTGFAVTFLVEAVSKLRNY
jgi:hypothetical protein